MSDDIYVNGHIRNLMSKRLAHDSSWSDSSLGTAFEVLECKFHWFGVVEEFARSMELFRASFTGCDSYQVPIKAANVSEKYDDTLDGRARQRLIELNHYDLLLYDRAVEIFHKRYIAMRIASWM